MEAKRTDRGLLWIALAIVAWNTFDVVVHVANGFVEVLRISGNIAAVAATLIAVLGKARRHTAHVSGAAALAVFVLNAIHSALHGFGIPMLVFVGLTVFLLLRSAQITLARQAERRGYHSVWAALIGALAMVVLVVLCGVYFAP
jgi:hypothetical protein